MVKFLIYWEWICEHVQKDNLIKRQGRSKTNIYSQLIPKHNLYLIYLNKVNLKLQAKYLKMWVNQRVTNSI